MSQREYLILLAQKGKSLKPLKEKFYEMNGFYNGIGYAFPIEQHDILKGIVKQLKDTKIIKSPLSEGQTFESMRQAHKASYFQEKLIKVENDLLVAVHDIPIQIADLSEETVLNIEISEEKKKD